MPTTGKYAHELSALWGAGIIVAFAAGLQPGTVATASMIVRASTASTSEAKKAAVIAGPMFAQASIMR